MILGWILKFQLGKSTNSNVEAEVRGFVKLRADGDSTLALEGCGLRDVNVKLKAEAQAGDVVMQNAKGDCRPQGLKINSAESTNS